MTKKHSYLCFWESAFCFPFVPCLITIAKVNIIQDKKKLWVCADEFGLGSLKPGVILLMSTFGILDLNGSIFLQGEKGSWHLLQIQTANLWDVLGAVSGLQKHVLFLLVRLVKHCFRRNARGKEVLVLIWDSDVFSNISVAPNHSRPVFLLTLSHHPLNQF